MLRFATLLIALTGVAASTAPLWPLPSSYKLGTTSFTLHGGFQFNIGKASSNEIIDQAAARYLKLIRVPLKSVGEISVCDLKIESSAVLDIIGADESYTVQVTDEGVCTLSAKNTWGLLRAMETFTQLLNRDESEKVVDFQYAPALVQDTPRYGHRGILIDTARHYLSVTEIQRIIKSLPISKFNVLHWHMVDAESFPINTPSEPTMIKGAFSPAMTYSMTDIQMIQEYARSYGVEIILELDIPGHAASWTAGKKEIMADCFAKYYYNINDFALNPTLSETYTTIDHILSDLITATKTKRIHLGGDEVVYGCWRNDSSIVAFMQQQGWTNYDSLLSYFVQQVDAISAKYGTAVTHWEEVFTAGSKVGANTQFQVWTDSSKIAAVTSAKYPVIASPSDYWYLNIATNTWQSMYSYDPTMNLTATQASYIVGGETALWGEYINDLNIETNIYPRACSVAERLWSPKTVIDTTDAQNRLIIQHCRLLNRGIQSSPIKPADYCDVQYI